MPLITKVFLLFSAGLTGVFLFLLSAPLHSPQTLHGSKLFPKTIDFALPGYSKQRIYPTMNPLEGTEFVYGR